jgi:hypothetical protein
VKAGDGVVVLIGGEPGNREIAPRADHPRAGA